MDSLIFLFFSSFNLTRRAKENEDEQQKIREKRRQIRGKLVKEKFVPFAL